MGSGGSTIVDCVQECDTKRLKEELAALRVSDETELANVIEDAAHTAVSMEIQSPQQVQQLQIALELLFRVYPRVIQTTSCNSCSWTLLHRACVTGNLEFLPYIWKHFPDHICNERDDFGLLPMDLVPPELLIDTHPSSGKNNSTTITPDQRVIALKLLRAQKIQRELAAISELQGVLQCSTNNQEEEQRSSAAHSKYFIRFEPNRDRLSPALSGNIHTVDLPLRLRYNLPKHDEVIHGYFQMIWRGVDDPRSEVPHYDAHEPMHDELATDSPPVIDDVDSNQLDGRRLHDIESAISGCIPVDVSHLPEEAVCHVLFVACDKHMMRRRVVLSTEGVRLHEPEDDPEEDHIMSDSSRTNSFAFYVAGEEFTHPSEALAGQEFDTVEEFQSFVKQLRDNSKKKRSPMSSRVAPVDICATEYADRNCVIDYLDEAHSKDIHIKDPSNQVD